MCQVTSPHTGRYGRCSNADSSPITSRHGICSNVYRHSSWHRRAWQMQCQIKIICGAIQKGVVVNTHTTVWNLRWVQQPDNGTFLPSTREKSFCIYNYHNRIIVHICESNVAFTIIIIALLFTFAVNSATWGVQVLKTSFLFCSELDTTWKNCGY